MSTINLSRLAEDIEEHTGSRPPLMYVADAATHLVMEGTFHLISRHGERIILAREHYEAAPGDARELDGDTMPTMPDVWLPVAVAVWFVLMAGILAWHGAVAWALFMTVLAVGCVAVAVCMARAGGVR